MVGDQRKDQNQHIKEISWQRARCNVPLTKPHNRACAKCACCTNDCQGFQATGMEANELPTQIPTLAQSSFGSAFCLNKLLLIVIYIHQILVFAHNPWDKRNLYKIFELWLLETLKTYYLQYCIVYTSPHSYQVSSDHKASSALITKDCYP